MVGVAAALLGVSAGALAPLSAGASGNACQSHASLVNNGGGSSYACAVLGDTPLGYWRLNDAPAATSFSDLLPANAQSFEDGSTGNWVCVTCTLANSTATAYAGTHSLQVTSSGAGGYAYAHSQPVIAGNAYTAWVHTEAQTAATSITDYIFWYGSGPTYPYISSTSAGGGSDSTSAWSASSVTGIAPGSAVYAIVIVQFGAASGQVNYIDGVSLAQTTFVVDSSGAGYTGAYTGGLSYSQPGLLPGPLGASVKFDGASAAATLGNPSAFSSLTSGSIEIWETTTSTSGVQGLVVKQGAFGIFLNNGYPYVYDWNIGTAIQGSTSLADGNPHYLAVTFQSGVSGGTKLYVDGSLAASGTITMTTTAYPLEIGRGCDTCQWFTGSLQEAALYSSVLTSTQVSTHYTTATAGGTGPAAIDFQTKSNGGAPTTMDTGQTVTIADTSAAPTVSGGALVMNPKMADSEADYYQFPVTDGSTGQGVQLGAEYTVPFNDGGDSSLGLILWQYPFAGSSTPQSRAHVAISPGSGSNGLGHWYYSVLDGSGDYVQITSGTFSTTGLKYDGSTVWSSEVDINSDNSASLHLPDGSVATVTAAQVTSALTGVTWSASKTLNGLSGLYGCVEHYANSDALGDANVSVLRVWSST